MVNNETSAALTLLLGILVALSALGTDLYVPALPDVAAWFASPVSAAFAFERLLARGKRHGER